MTAVTGNTNAPDFNPIDLNQHPTSAGASGSAGVSNPPRELPATMPSDASKEPSLLLNEKMKAATRQDLGNVKEVANTKVDSEYGGYKFKLLQNDSGSFFLETSQRQLGFWNKKPTSTPTIHTLTESQAEKFQAFAKAPEGDRKDAHIQFTEENKPVVTTAADIMQCVKLYYDQNK